MKQLEPQLTVRAVAPVVAGLEALGHDVDAILAAAPMSPTLLEDPYGRVPHSAMMRFWTKALEESSDGCLGIHVAEAAPIESFGLHAYTVLSSRTLRDAYRRACRYQRLIHEATDLVFEEGDEVGMLHHSLPGGLPIPRHPAEFLVTVWLRFGRQVTGTSWTPERACFAHAAPQDCSEHVRVFGSSLRFASGRTSMSIANPILDSTNPHRDEGLLGVLDEHARLMLERVPERPTVSARVRAHLGSTLEDGAPTVERIARDLNFSVRSLHRALRMEGTTFREILDQLRHERAASMLAGSGFSIPEIGYLLGFAEISSFYRAFRRWTGMTPARYRAELGRETGAGPI